MIATNTKCYNIVNGLKSCIFLALSFIAMISVAQNAYSLPYCNALESGVIPIPEGEPNPNCTQKICTNLTVAELSNIKNRSLECCFTGDLPDENGNCPDPGNCTDDVCKSKYYCHYCDNDTKCYNFNKNKLPYVFYNNLSTQCQLHECPPLYPSPLCTDGTVNITNKGDAYVAAYEQYLLNGNSIESICLRGAEYYSCKPIIVEKYACDCDSVSGSCIKSDYCTGECDTEGFCTNTIDCNDEANNNEDYCQFTSDNGELSLEEDPYESWFYRPIPSPTSFKKTTNLDRRATDYLSISGGNTADNDQYNNICMTIDGDEEGYDFSQNEIDYNEGEGTIDREFYYGGGFFMFSSGEINAPPYCDTSKWGLRGAGPLYTCGTSGSICHQPNIRDQNPGDAAAYIRGRVHSDYSGAIIPNDATVQIESCLRFKNSGELGACGARKCNVRCGFGICGRQWCGSDVCEVLTVTPGEVCTIGVNDEKTGEVVAAGNEGCVSKFNFGEIRFRARRYANKVCVFLDQWGCGGATGGDFLDLENGTLDDGTPIDDTDEESGIAKGWKSWGVIQYSGNNGYVPCDELEDSTSKRRCMKSATHGTGVKMTCKQIQIGGLAAFGERYQNVCLGKENSYIVYLGAGYTTMDGIFYAEQQCAKIEMPTGPQRFYRVATIENTPDLFMPPVVIRNIDEEVSFYEPEISIGFGSEVKDLKLNADQIQSNIYTLTSLYQGKEVSVKVFIEKTEKTIKEQPQCCLYRVFESGTSTVNKEVGCVNRKKPTL